MFAYDNYRHAVNNSEAEYGNIPYITGHSKYNDASFLWVNAADTWTDILPSTDGKSMLTNFVSESG